MARFADMVLAEVDRLVEPLRAAVADVRTFEDDPEARAFPYGLWTALDEMGLIDRQPGDPFEILPRLAGDVEAAIGRIPARAQGGDPWAAAHTLIGALNAVLTVLETLSQLPDSALSAEEVGNAVWRWLLWRRIAELSPLWDAVLDLTGVTAPPFGRLGPRIDIARLRALVTDPAAVLEDSIGWGAVVEIVQLSHAIDRGLAAMGIAASRYVVEDWPGADAEAPTEVLRFDAALDPHADAGLFLGPDDAGMPRGLLIRPHGRGALDAAVALSDRCTIELVAEARADALPGLLITPEGIASEGRADLQAAVALIAEFAGAERGREGNAPRERLTLLPLAGFGAITAERVSLGATISTRVGEAGLTTSIKAGKIRVGFPETDGFVSGLLRNQEVAAPFSMVLAWSASEGLTIAGNAGLETDITVGAALGGALAVDTVHLCATHAETAAELSVALTGSGRLGPFRASVSRIGVVASLSSAAGAQAEARSGAETLTLGPVAASLAFLPPRGLGLALDVGPIEGGGFLEFDTAAGRYAGALALRAEVVGLSAFGVILTRMPNGQPGFSMLAFVQGPFTPIQLGFGFTLNAVGGLLGIHRDLDHDALFAAVRAGRAGDLLAPEDSVRDAPALIAQAEAIFPPRHGRHVFGPTLQLGWGAPESLITLDLALALTLPEPLRILLIGRIQAALPDKRVPLLLLNLDVAGILDLSRGTLDLEGRLFDSKVQAIPITGGFVLKMGWKATRAFIFSVGGLHPGFKPPTGFPTLPRAGVDLSKSSSFTLRLEAYFAITSNTLQIGAAVDLLARLKGFGLECHVGFDALIVFEPFELDAALRASARIFRDSKTLMRLALKARLRGPGPWRIDGSVSFEIFWVDVTLRVSKSIGAAVERAEPRVDVAAILVRELEAMTNWTAEGSGPLVLTGDAGRVMPGPALRFSQKKVPLGLDMDQFGGFEIEGARRFDMAGLTFGSTDAELSNEPPREPFAVGSVLRLSERDRLVADDFQDLVSGLVADPGTARCDGPTWSAPSTRRVVRIDARPGHVPPTPAASVQEGWTAPAIAVSRGRSRPAPAVGMAPERWVPGGPDSTSAPFDSWAEARQASPDGTVTRWSETTAFARTNP